MYKYFVSTVYLLLLLLSACSTNYGRYQQSNDSTPARLPHPSELHDAIPRIEPKSKGGNKNNYQVRGKRYHVLDSADNFSQQGIASWYGKKFHGHLTSNGEIYNMYGMSAAHKNLPLPTYVKVTNLDNNKSVVVRVNDRGPFHHSRIIDLSYSAAYKLDMLKTGTGNVLIEAITDKQKKTKSVLSKTKVNQSKVNQVAKLYIQVVATSNQKLAKQTAEAISSLYQLPAQANEEGGVFRVQVGPIKKSDKLIEILTRLKQSGYPNAFKIAL
ncbi:septal ring lytic transglycosylase RlpA family protein [bacterium]|nr:septal ring lytic transglycosylase RlpA family protein [bacterium]